MIWGCSDKKGPSAVILDYKTPAMHLVKTPAMRGLVHCSEVACLHVMAVVTQEGCASVSQYPSVTPSPSLPSEKKAESNLISEMI